MVCRVCLLDTNNSMMDIFGPEGEQLNIANIVGQHFWFEPEEGDPISSYICYECWQQLDSFHSFYLRVEEAQRNLQSNIPVEYISTGEIKIEPDDYPFPDIENPYNEIEEKSGKTFNPFEETKTEAVSDGSVFTLGEFVVSEVNEDKIKHSSIQSDRAIITEESHQQDANIQIEKTSSQNIEERDMKMASREKDIKIAAFMKLTCEQCEYQGETFADVKKHYETIHHITGYIMCCGRKFCKRSSLLDHVSQHLDPQYFKCKECNKSYSRRDHYNKHLKDHTETKVKLFKCDVCAKEFHTQPLLSRHKFIHMPLDQMQYFCDVCKKPFGSNALLRDHKRFVHENVCEICSKVIRGKKEFEKHQIEHGGFVDSTLKCDICGALFKSQATLKLHMDLHTDNNEYLCNICGTKARSKSSLEVHIRNAHCNKHLFKCTLCEKIFKRKSKLTEHLTTHTGEKSQRCPYCSKSYYWKGNLNTHLKRSHPEEWEERRKKRGGTNDNVACMEFNV